MWERCGKRGQSSIFRKFNRLLERNIHCLEVFACAMPDVKNQDTLRISLDSEYDPVDVGLLTKQHLTESVIFTGASASVGHPIQAEDLASRSLNRRSAIGDSLARMNAKMASRSEKVRSVNSTRYSIFCPKFVESFFCRTGPPRCCVRQALADAFVGVGECGDIVLIVLTQNPKTKPF